MATKKTNNDLDDFNFDDDIFGDLGDFGNEGSRKKRGPIREFTSGFGLGAKDAITSPSLIKALASQILPSGYGSAINVADTIMESGRRLYDEAAAELKPAIPALKSAVGKIAAATEGKIPGKVSDILKEFAQEEESYRQPSQEELDNETIQKELLGVFASQGKANARRSAADRAERLLRYKVEDRQQTDMLRLLSLQSSSLDRLVAYQDKVAHPWRQKTLELQYRQTFYARDMVAMQRQTIGLLKDGFKALVHNTAMSDYEKKSLLHATTESYRDKLIGNAQTAASKYVSGFTQNLTKNLSDKVKEFAGGLSMGIQELSGGSDMMDSVDGLPGGKAGMAGSSIGGMVTELLAPYLAMIPQKVLARHKGLNRSGGKINLALSQLPENIQGWTNSDTDVTSIYGNLIQLTKELLRNNVVQETKVGDSAILSADKPAQWDALSRRSLVEIIPGYLARILQSTESLRLGEQAPLTIYNMDRNRFTSVDTATADAKSRIFNKNNVYSVQKSVNEVVDRLDDGTLTPELRKKLATKLVADSQKMIPINERYFSEEALSGEFGADDAAAIGKSIQRRLYRKGHLNTKRLQDIVDRSKSVRSNMFDVVPQLQVYRDTGNVELLEALGLVSSHDTDGLGRVDRADLGRIYEMILSGEGLAPEKKSEKDTWLTGLGKQYAGAWDRKTTDIADQIYRNKAYQSVTGKIGSAAAAGVEKAKRWWMGDLYIENSDQPIITEQAVFNGEYRDQASGETIQTPDDIQGPVVDRADNVVLSAQQMIRGVYDRRGKRIRTFEKRASSFLTRLRAKVKGSRASQALNAGLNRLGAAGNRVGAAMSSGGLSAAASVAERELTDIYVEGRKHPAITAAAMQLGEYRDQVTGKIIRTIEEIRGPVTDSQGKVVLTAQDFVRGIRDRTGNELKSIMDRAKQRIRGLAESAQLIARDRSAPTIEGATQGTGSEGQQPGIGMTAADQQMVEERAAIQSQYYREALDLSNKQLMTLIEINESIVALQALTGGQGGGEAIKPNPPWYKRSVGDLAKSSVGGIFGGIGKGAGMLATGTKNYFKGAFKLQWKAVKGAGALATAGAVNATDLLLHGKRRRAADIYLKGHPEEPVMLRRKLIDGKYVDKETGKTIKNIDDIDGAVIDLDTNSVVLTAEEVNDPGIYDLLGKTLRSRINKGLRSLIGGFSEYGLKAFAAPFKLVGHAIDFAMGGIALINEEQDVYIRGRKKPVILIRDLKAGRYFSGKTGKPIYSLKDIDGEVFRIVKGQKEIVITEEEAQSRDFVNWRGKPLRTIGQSILGGAGSLAGLAGRSAMGLVRGYAQVMGAVMGAGKDLLVGTARGIGRFFNPKGRPIGADEKTIELLTDIFRVLESRLPVPKKIRKGSWEEQFAKRDANKAEAEDDKKDDARSAKYGLGGIMGWMGSKLKSLFGRDDDQEDEGDEEDDDSLLDDAADAAVIGDAVGGRGGDAKARRKAAKARLKRMRKGGHAPRAGKYGRLGRLGRTRAGRLLGRVPGLGKAGRGLARAGTLGTQFLGRAAGPAGTALAIGYGAKEAYDISQDSSLTAGRKHEGYAGAAGGTGGALAGMWAGAAAGTLIGGPIGTVIGGGIGAVAGSSAGKWAGKKAMGGFRDYKNLIKAATNRNPLFKLRMAQYGIDVSDLSTVKRILQLEYSIQNKMFNGPEDLFEAMELDDGWFSNKGNQRAQFMAWLGKRFWPVYNTWQTALQTYQLDTKSGFDVAEKLDKTKLKPFIDSVYNGASGAYGVMIHPFNEDPSEIGPKQVENVKLIAVADLEKSGLASAVDKMKGVSRTLAAFTPFGALIVKASDRADAKRDEQTAEELRQKQKTGGDPKAAASAAANAITGTAAVSKADQGFMQLTALQSIRFKAYGLKELAADRIATLRKLEAEVVKDITVSGKEAKYGKTVQQAFDQFAASFGIPANERGRKRFYWEEWFSNRFLPVILAYISACRQFNVTNPWASALGLKAAEELEVGRAMIGATYRVALVFKRAIWSMTLSPWDVEEQLNGDAESCDGNLKAIQQQSVKNTASETTAAKGDKPSTPKAVSDAQKRADRAWGTSGPAYKERTSSDPNTSEVAGGFRGAEQADAEYWKSKNVDPNNILMINNRPSIDGGQRIQQPGNGTGGDINALPESQGVGAEANRALIEAAAKMAGVDPALMMTIAGIESKFDPTARPWRKPQSKSGGLLSSAKGFFQFLDGTWSDMMRKYAKKYGIDPNTSALDPRANALMGAEFLKENAVYMKKITGRDATDNSIYAAHFLGRGDAAKLFASPPDAIASALLPAPARSNPSIFYKNGSPRTVNQVIEELNRRVAAWRKYGKASFGDVKSSVASTENVTASTPAQGSLLMKPDGSASTGNTTATTGWRAPSIPGVPSTGAGNIGSVAGLATASQGLNRNVVRDESMQTTVAAEQAYTQQSIQRNQLEAASTASIQREVGDVSRQQLEVQKSILVQAARSAAGIETLVAIARASESTSGKSKREIAAEFEQSVKKPPARQPNNRMASNVSPISTARSSGK